MINCIFLTKTNKTNLTFSCFYFIVGVSSGGDFNDKNTGDSCKPYAFQSCAHHVDPPKGTVPCNTLPEFKTPVCTNTCDDNNYDIKYKMDKFKAKSSYSIKGEQNIQKEIMERGTITVAFVVYSDFELYKVGIYQHVKGKRKSHKEAAYGTLFYLFAVIYLNLNLKINSTVG